MIGRFRFLTLVATIGVMLLIGAASPSEAAVGREFATLWGVNQPPPGSIIKIWNGHAPYRCLDADTGTINRNGTRVQLWDCNGQPQQRWQVFAYPVTGAIGLLTMHSSPYRKLDADVHSMHRNGTIVHLWDQNFQPQQQWNPASQPRNNDFVISGHWPHRCLDADTNSMNRNGTIVQLWDCNSQPQQRWYWAYD